MLNYDGKKRWSLEQQVAINKCKNKQNEDAIEGIKHDLTSVYKIKGSATVATLNGLVKTTNLNGNVYNVTVAGNLTNEDSSVVSVNAGDNVLFIWNDGEWYWDILAGVLDLSGYLQKVNTFTTFDQIYGKAQNGSQSMYNLATFNTANTLIFRNANGRSKISTPVDSTDIANKFYVDSNLPTIIRG